MEDVNEIIKIINQKTNKTILDGMILRKLNEQQNIIKNMAKGICQDRGIEISEETVNKIIKLYS